MNRKVLILGAALVATLAFIVAGRGLLPGSVQLRVPNSNAVTQNAPMPGHGTTPQQAPQPIVAPPGGSRVTLAVTTGAKPELGYILSASVTSPAGKAVSEATVRFYDVVDLFGQREELIGSGTTDGQGNVAISYLPAIIGTHQIVARFAGQGSLIASLGTTTFEAKVTAKPYTVDQPPLAGFSRAVPYVVGMLVLAVWGLIAFSLFGTARGVVATANSTRRKGETA